MNKCTHTRTISGKWVDLSDDDDGYCHGYWEDDIETSTTVDIDLHRYKCTQCGEVMYYSQAARNYYENGIPHPLFETSKRR